MFNMKKLTLLYNKTMLLLFFSNNNEHKSRFKNQLIVTADTKSLLYSSVCSKRAFVETQAEVKRWRSKSV